MRPTLTFIKSQLRDFAAFASHYADVRIVAAFEIKRERFFKRNFPPRSLPIHKSI